MCTHNGEAGAAAAGWPTRPAPAVARKQYYRSPAVDTRLSLHSTARIIQLLRKDIFLTFHKNNIYSIGNK